MKVALFCLLLVSGLVAVSIALLTPAHLRAVDPYVLKQHGAAGKSLVDAASDAAPRNPGVAKLFLAAAEELKLSGTDKVVEQLRIAAADRTRSRTLLERLEEQESGRIQVLETPVLTALRKSTNRAQIGASIHSAEAKQILHTRNATNMTLFAPATSAAGVPLDVAALTTAFLMEQRAFPSTLPLRDEILRLTGLSNTQPLEELYLSIFALARRFSSEQIIAFTEKIPSSAALHTLTRWMQEKPDATPLLYSAAVLSKNAGAVAYYLDRFPDQALQDLSFALGSGISGLNHLLASEQQVYRCRFYSAAAESSGMQFIFRPLLSLGTSSPILAILVKYLLMISGAFLIAWSFRYRPIRSPETGYQFIPRISLFRRIAFTCLFLLLAIIIGEPYLAQGEPESAPPLWKFPVLGAATTPPPSAAAQPKISTPMVDQQTILAVLTFVVLQSIIYAVCLMKLAEIRKQPVSNEIKLKLLENEDHLFDAGLYAGLFGTAASLILLTLGAIKPSLVSAYSSTLFGILSVATLKIGHVRPLKRRLLLEPLLGPTGGPAAGPAKSSIVSPTGSPVRPAVGPATLPSGVSNPFIK